MPQEQGAILLLVILVIALLVTLASRYLIASRVNWRMADNVWAEVAADQAFENMVVLSTHVLHMDWRYDSEGDPEDEAGVDGVTGDDSDHLLEQWATKGGAEDPVWFHNWRVTWKLSDEQARFNINHVIDEQGVAKEDRTLHLKRLCELLSMEDYEVVGDAIVDWLDHVSEDATGGATEGGSEEEGEYEADAKNYFLYSLEELLQLPQLNTVDFYGDLDHKEHHGLADMATIWGDGLININTASPTVLESLHENMDSQIVDNIINARKDEAIKDLNNLQEVLGVSESELNAEDLAALLKVDSEFFRLECVLQDASHQQFPIKRRAIFRRDPEEGKVEVLYRDRDPVFAMELEDFDEDESER